MSSRHATLIVGLFSLLASTALAGKTTRVSVSSDGAQATGGSAELSSISADGMFVAFDADATNLVAGDTNANSDIFVHERKKGVTTRVSVASSGEQSIGGDSYFPSISADGRFVAFESSATNLVPGDTNDTPDIFVHDRKTGTTTRVSIGSGGEQSTGLNSEAAISGNGRYVAFLSTDNDLVEGDTNLFTDVFLHDRKKGTTIRVSVDSAGGSADGQCFDPEISANGRWIVFGSSATNLVADDTNALGDVFLHDRKTGTTRRVSLDSSGAQATGGGSFEPQISANGRVVAFSTLATNLVAGDTNGAADIFTHDRRKGITTCRSLDSSGVPGNGSSRYPVLSKSGRIVAFQSQASNLVLDDTNGVDDILVHDRKKGRMRRASVDTNGEQALGEDCHTPSISANGRFVGFTSKGANLVPADTNATFDIFVHDRK